MMPGSLKWPGTGTSEADALAATMARKTLKPMSASCRGDGIPGDPQHLRPLQLPLPCFLQAQGIKARRLELETPALHLVVPHVSLRRLGRAELWPPAASAVVIASLREEARDEQVARR